MLPLERTGTLWPYGGFGKLVLCIEGVQVQATLPMTKSQKEVPMGGNFEHSEY